MDRDRANKTVVIIANSSSGLYGFRGELIQEIIKKGHRVIALTPFNGKIEELEELGVEVRQISMERRGINPFKDIKLLYHYYIHLKQLKPNLIITYTIKPNIYGGMLARLMKIPYVSNITGLGTTFQKENFIKALVVFLYKVAFGRVKIVFFENVENRELFLKEKIVRADQTYVLNGAGVNLKKYSFCEYPVDESIRFLFIGRVMKEKGVDELFEVAKRIKTEHQNVFFDIVGPMEENYTEKVDELVKLGIIKYHGYQSDVRPFIEKCHCFVLPSYHEGMANTLLEASAMGRPLITSNIHGCKEAVVKGESGYLVKKEDSEDLYEKTRRFVQLKFEEKQSMGLAARKHMEKIFDKKKVVAETISRLKGVS